MVRVLWVDLCVLAQQPRLSAAVPHDHRLLVIDRTEDFARAVREFQPGLACIEFDYPDACRLHGFAYVRHAFPALPLMMFTEYHSEALAVWAFRSGVWDYRVKPVDGATLARSIEVLAHARGCGAASVSRVCMPPDLIEPAGHLRKPPTATPRSGAAIAYIAGHYGESIRREAVARFCHLSPSEFSRAFRRENGIAFGHYLLRFRISVARGLLAEPGNSTAQVAYEVGFNDPSYFCRAFRRLVGTTARTYQQRARIGPVPTVSRQAH